MIKPADKGGSIVVMSSEQYDRGIKSHLCNDTFYSPLSSDPTVKLKSEIDTFIDSSLQKGWITEQEKYFLTTKHPICPAFYGLPKIHKTTVDPPLRPIVSGNGSLIEPMSQYIDFFIKKLVPDLPAYLGDTTDILNAVNHLKVSTDCILATLDVQSLSVL